MSRSKSPQEHPIRDGHRRGRRPGFALFASLTAVGLSVSLGPASAHAGTFEVSQCKTVGLTPSANAGYQTGLWDPAAGVVGAYVGGCTGDGAAMDVHQANRRLFSNEYTVNRFTLPASMSGSTISAVDIGYEPYQQSASVNPAYFSIVAGSTTLVQHDQTVAYSTTNRRLTTPVGSRGFDLRVWCSPANGSGYCNWSTDTYRIFGLTMTLQESVLPNGDASGALLGAGEQTGTRPLDLSGSDADSGVRNIDVTLDGVSVGGADLTAECRVDRFSPCPTSVAESVDVDTTKVPDGSRLLRLVVTDLAGNTRTVNKGYIAVENVPPPSNSSLPTISGEKRVNRTLASTAGSWTGASLSYTYRWERYAANGWEDIPDATQASFTTTKHETGMRLRLRVTASNDEGATTAYSDATNPIVAPGPTDADGDFDGDGVANDADHDDDGDGTPDAQDAGPFDPRVGAPGGAEAPRPVGIEPTFNTPNGQNASNAATLSAQFSDNHSKTITTRYGRTRHITGRLVAPTGAPIGGAQLTVMSQTLAMGAKPVTAGTVTTDSAGRFRFAVPVGASRKIEVAYKWFRESVQNTHTTTVTVNVVPRVTMKADRVRLRNGQSVRFAGKVAGAPRDARKVVELQARVGRAWQTFGTARLRRNGTFAYRYRFTRTSRPTTYQFRATVKAERGWPFMTGQTRTAKVSVRP